MPFADDKNSQKVQRRDIAELREPRTTPDGRVVAEAFLTRTGVFAYKRADGSTRLELRPPDEVLKYKSLAGLELAPLTLNHPNGNVTPSNAKDTVVGTVGERVSKTNDGKIRATISIYRDDAIEAAKSTHQELSCGYTCNLDETAGTFNGQRYDAIQRDISYNHVALVERGRAGPQVRVRMDSEDTVYDGHYVATETKQAQKEEPMASIRIDGVDFEATEQTAQAVAKRLDEVGKELQAVNEKTADVEAKLEEATNRADKAEKALAEEKERADTA